MSDNYRLARRLFAHFVKLYGSQRVLSMYRDPNLQTQSEVDAHMDSIYAVWETETRKFPQHAIRDAAASLVQTGGEWPPSLPQWIALCKQFNRPEHAPATALPAPAKSETGEKYLANLRAMLRKS